MISEFLAVIPSKAVRAGVHVTRILVDLEKGGRLKPNCDAGLYFYNPCVCVRLTRTTVVPLTQQTAVVLILLM
jgi:hypothetical protein